jgi:hypothetical protein
MRIKQEFGNEGKAGCAELSRYRILPVLWVANGAGTDEPRHGQAPGYTRHSEK